MIRTGKHILHDLTTGRSYAIKAGESGVYVYCDNVRISENETTQVVWDYLLSLVHTDLTKTEEVQS